MSHLNYANDEFLTALPANLQATRLTVRGCKNLKRLPTGLKAFTVDAEGSGLVEVPPSVRVENSLNLSGCTNLTRLGENLRVASLNLSGCTALTDLPEGLDVDFLDISGCTALRGFPKRMSFGGGRLTARDCSWLRSVPPAVQSAAQLDFAGCSNLTALPDGLEVVSWLDVANTGITSLPASLRNARLRWRGVLVNARIVFEPETITGQEVLDTPNAEIRRVMLERIGMERFLADVQPKVRDRDRDAGGPRQLLRVRLPDDEDLVCLSVSCPSTGRAYLLRVPPSMKTCHQAAAWIAGFDDPTRYAPVAET